MKNTRIFSTVVALLLVGLGWGQITYYEGNAAEIEVDFSTETKTIKLPENLKIGDFFQIKVNKINLNKWSVLLNTKDTTITSKFTTPTFADLQVETLSALVSSLNFSTNVQEKSLEDVKNDFSLFSQEPVYDSPEPKPKDPSEEQIEIQEKLEAAKKYINEQVDDNNAYTKDIDDLKYNVSKKQLGAVDDSGTINMDFDFEDALSSIEDLRTNLGNFEKDLMEKEKEYLKFSEEKRTDIDAEKNFKEADEKIKEKYFSLKANASKMQKAVNAENATSMLKKVLYLKDKTENYVSLPIQFKNELVSVNLKFVPRDSLLLEDPREIEFVFPTQRNNYWSLDAAFFVSSLYDQNFSSITTVISDTEKEVRFVEEDATKAEIGFASLIRYGWISHNAEKGIHIVFGPGVSISEKVRPRLLAGIGTSFGEKHGFTIDIGALAGFVNRKSNVFELDDTLNEVPESLTVTKLKLGGFIAIGYIFKL